MIISFYYFLHNESFFNEQELKMKEKIRLLILVLSLAFLYGIIYLIFIHTAKGNPIWGVIPEILVYIIPAYFVFSIIIEITMGESPSKNIKISLKKALILLLFFLLCVGFYWLFYKYIIVENHLEVTLIGEKSYLVFIGVMIFFGLRFANKLYSK